LLLESITGKKRFSRGVLLTLPDACALPPQETLRILAPEGIANFGIALAKHFNLVFSFFILQID